VREIAGSLEVVAGAPEKIVLDPLERTALEWAWQNGEPSGSGTAAVSAASWRFEPLRTSLATLAVLGLVRADGRDPVPAERKLLLSTMVSQSALALERLRLEDIMKAR
jgi:two-component system sensor histidine kinase KdpD